MSTPMIHKTRLLRSGVLALSLAASLSGCIGGVPDNRSLESVNQPVIKHTNYTLDISAGANGMSIPEQRRLIGWFDALNLRYGDRITIDDPQASAAARSAIEAVAGRYGLLVGGDAPITPGYVNPGTVRVVVTRATASVPNCPNWDAKSDANPLNATSKNYGCSINGNLAAMVANPEHLLKGEDTGGSTVVMSSDKAIGVYRNAQPSGAGGLKQTSTSGN